MSGSTPQITDPVSGEPCVASQWSNSHPESNTAAVPDGAPAGMYGNQVEPTLRNIMTAIAQVLGVAVTGLNHADETAVQVNNVLSAITNVPSGAIMMWDTGTHGAVPTGWHACDGTNGTPDWRDKFILSAGTTYADQSSGGSSTATATTSAAGSHAHGSATETGGAYNGTTVTDLQGAHVHSGATGLHALTTGELPAHSHTYTVASSNSGSNNALAATPTSGTNQGTTDNTGSGNGHSHNISSDGIHGHNVAYSVPAHTHAIDTDGLHSHTLGLPTMPPYLARLYIMKL